MASPTFGIRESGRRGARSLRFVRPLVALVAAMLPVAAVASSCGGDAPEPGSTTGAAGDPGDFQIEIDLPPDIEARLLELATELGAAICERGRNCCDHYGFEPRTDCVRLGGEIFAYRLLGVVGIDEVDLSEFEFSIDEALAERCIEVARSTANQCILSSTEFIEWFEPCYWVLDGHRKGEVSDECTGDEACEVKHGPGYGCLRQNVCLPIVEVEEGADCGLPQGGPTLPACSASHYCNGTCMPRAALGEPCPGSEACVPGAYCDGSCVPRLPLGAPCPSDAACAEGMRCECPKFGISCEERFCFEAKDAGEPCSADPECHFPTRCVDGICKPGSIGFCEPP